MKEGEKKSAEVPEETAEAEKHAELVEITRRAAREECARWAAENRQKKRKIRKWILSIAGLVILILMVGFLFLLMEPQSDPIIVNEDTIPMLSPIDSEAVAKIDAMEGYSPDDTWTFYLYWVGSNLESGTSNQLSDLVTQMISEEVQQIKAEEEMIANTQLLQLSDEIAQNGLEFPYYLFAPQSDLNMDTYYVEEEPYVQGDASQDLWEYRIFTYNFELSYQL